MKPDEIVHAMASKYQNCFSYRDKGRVDSNDGAISFKTCFKRPGQFCFEWTESSSEEETNFIWSDGKENYHYFLNDKKMVRDKNLNLGIAAATGISKGAAQLVPQLLMPDMGGRNVSRLTPFRDNEKATFQKESIRCLVWSNPGERESLWINGNTFDLVEALSVVYLTDAFYQNLLAQLSQIPQASFSLPRTANLLTRKNRLIKSHTFYEEIIFDSDVGPYLGEAFNRVPKFLE
jgi:hypothetical protein